MRALLTFPIAFLLALVLAPCATAQGKVMMTVPEALELAFPGCEVERSRVALTDAQRKRVAELGGGKLATATVRPYVARKDGAVVGTAYFDRHRVRTKPEVLMVVITPQCKIRRIELLAFAEPPEYIPRASWYDQFDARALTAELSLRGEIRGVTGATLTARATTAAARRILALHQVIAGSAPHEAPAGKRKTDATKSGDAPPKREAGDSSRAEAASGRRGTTPKTGGRASKSPDKRAASGKPTSRRAAGRR